APLELQRPRGSGPLDLLVVAPGALPLHTRAFTDRDDKLALRLVAESGGPSLLGYRPEPAPTENPPRPDSARSRHMRGSPRNNRARSAIFGAFSFPATVLSHRMPANFTLPAFAGKRGEPMAKVLSKSELIQKLADENAETLTKK